MLLHLDVKEPGLEEDIAKLLDSADMWDHVVEINESNAAALRKNPKAQRLAYKAFGWQEGRMDMSPEKVRDGLAKPGNMIMVDDPRVAARELKRKALRVRSRYLRAPGRGPRRGPMTPFRPPRTCGPGDRVDGGPWMNSESSSLPMGR
jgi:hypothetical protein